MDRIILLLKQQKQTNGLADWLAKNYQVLSLDADQSLDFAFDLAIVDVPTLPVRLEHLQARRHAAAPVFLPILLVTSRGQVSLVMSHLWQTVDDIIWTPITSIELQARVGMLLRARRFSLEAQRLAITDALTGTHNRRHFFALGERELHRAKRFQRSIAAIMVEVDHFPRLNFIYGYEMGDQVLSTIAQRLLKGLRTIDLLGRFSEEKFVVLQPDTDRAGAVKAAERLRQLVCETPVETAAGPVAVTLSMGISSADGDLPTLEDLIDRADAALCGAKQAGRNCVMVEHRPILQ